MLVHPVSMVLSQQAAASSFKRDETHARHRFVLRKGNVERDTNLPVIEKRGVESFSNVERFFRKVCEIESWRFCNFCQKQKGANSV